MFDVSTAGLIIALLLALVLLGVHVAVALGVTSAMGIYMVTGKLRIVEAMLAGLPALVTKDCGYAKYLSEYNAGIVLANPFSQSIEGKTKPTLTPDYPNIAFRLEIAHL